VLGLLAAATVWRLPVTSDLSLFLPRAATVKQQVLLEQLNQGTGNRLLLAAISGGGAAERARTSRALTAALGDSPRFLRVANGARELSGPERDLLLRNRYLLSPRVDADRFRPESLRRSLERRLEELRSPASAFTKDLLARDPTGELWAILARLQQGPSPSRRDGVWASRDGGRALMVLYTHAPGTALDAQEAAQTELRRTFRRVRAAPGLRLELTGPGVFGVQARERIRREATRLSIAGSLGVALLLLVLFRSPRVLLLAALPLATGVLAGMWAVWAAFGAIHGITIAFGVTLLGLAIDYPLHLLSHIRGGQPPPRALASVWPTLRLGVLTTAVAFAVLITTDFRGLMQLGLFSATGLLAAAAVTRWGLPPLCRDGLAGAPPRPRLTRLLRPSAPMTALVLTAAAVAAVALARGLPGHLERDLQALSPVPGDELARFRALQGQLGTPDIRRFLVVTGDSRQQALRRTEALRGRLQALQHEGLIERFRTPADVLPSLATQRRRQRALPERHRLAANLDEATSGLPFRAHLFEPFLDDVATARSQPLLRLDDLAGTFLHARTASLLAPVADGSAALVPLMGLSGDPAAVAEVRGRFPDPGVRFLDLKAETERLVSGFLAAGASRLALGAAVLALLVGAALRSWRRLAGVVLPVGLALVTTAGALVLLGERLTIFHTVALLLVFGITVDYSLFFGRPEAAAVDRERTLRALTTCMASTLLVFGALAASAIPVLHQTGLTAALGVASGFLLAMTLSPRLSGR